MTAQCDTFIHSMRGSLLVAAMASIVFSTACRSDSQPTAQHSDTQAALLTFAQHAATIADRSDKPRSSDSSLPELPAMLGEAMAESQGPPAGYFQLEAEVRSDPEVGHVLLLTEPHSGIKVPIFIGGTESLSIRLRLQHRRYSRPLTHDLFDEMLRRLGAKVLWAQVDAIDAGIFTGTLVLNTETNTSKLDARPSDAIAIAIGNRAPIYVSQEVLTVAGFSPKPHDNKPRPKRTEPLAL